MNPLIREFEEVAFQAIDELGLDVGQVKRGKDFALLDFLSRGIQQTDDAATIAINAVNHFCSSHDAYSDACNYAIMTVCAFLDSHVSGTYNRTSNTFEAGKGLRQILRRGRTDADLRTWIGKHFGL